MSLPLSKEFRSLVLNNTQLIDVRAPVEFEKGAFINAHNLPLLNDEERQLVGICYKKKGNDAAVKLGYELIQAEVKEQRVDAWKEFIKENPEAHLYCFRGGQRSRISQQWLHDEGINITRLKGGYKAFRNFLMSESERILQSLPMLIIGGRTGSGKTLLLHQLDNAIDLEGLANHRGSSFGRFISPQPAQIDFENALAYELIQKESTQVKEIIIEHESQNIGRLFIPHNIFTNFQKSPLIILETPLDERINITFDEYVKEAIEQYKAIYKDEGDSKWAEDIRSSFLRIKKRLGSERYLKLSKIFDDAYQEQIKDNSLEAHKKWIKSLLNEYYDPMYDYQIKKTKLEIIFRGNKEEVLEFIAER